MAGITTIYHYDNGDEFPVEWASADDAARAYTWDAQHTPYACTPLSSDYLEQGILQFKSGGTSQRPMPRFIAHPHGFWYTPGTPEALPNGVGQAIRENSGTINPEVANLRKIWRKEHAPEVQSACRELQTQASLFAVLSTVADQLRDSFALAMKGWNATISQVRSMITSHIQLLVFCEDTFGDEADQLTNILEHGFANATSHANIALWKLSQIANEDPEVLSLLHSEKEDDTFAALAGVPGGAGFVAANAAYLKRYGFRGDGWFELATPTPNETPMLVLEQLRQILVNGEPDPRLAIARSARLRRATTRRLRGSLSNKPEKLAEFNRVLEEASQYVAVKEDRGLWQLTIPGSLRVPCLAAGRLLADHNVLDIADDIFYLHLDDIAEIATNPDRGNWKELVATRRKEYAAHKTSNPPANIGGQYEVAATQPSGGAPPLTTGEVLHGIPASAGVIEGKATVVRALDEAGKLEAGDILVCNSTSPAWTTLFSRISGVVTTGGGPLSHTAIVAREYKIPCVLDVKDVTVKVQDGMRVRVDGAKGTVELVG